MCPNGIGVYIYFHDAAGQTLAPDNTMCLKFIDTEREQAIGLGVSWPYP